MLANSFLKAEQLGITEEEVAALVKVLGMLERGEIKNTLFDMNAIGAPECGTPGCLIGWARTMCRDFYGAGARRLCWPYHEPSAFNASAAQAAIALRNYLTTGEPRWSEALAS